MSDLLLGGMPLVFAGESRSISHENRTGGRGIGGQANAGRKGSACHGAFEPGEVFTLAEIDGPGCIRHIWMTTPPGNPTHDRNLILRFYWDGQETPSVEAPLGDFFGMAHGRRRHYDSALTCMPEGRGLSCFYPMPFAQHCRITAENDSGEVFPCLFYQVDYTVGDALEGSVAYFHAQFRRQNPTVLKQDYVILNGVEGKGRFLGCVVGLRTLDKYWWGEGEAKFYIDGDTDFPTICGTGSEDYLCSAWGVGQHFAQYHGCPLIVQTRPDDLDTLVSYYRWHVPDPIYFSEDLRVEIQQIGGGRVVDLIDRIDAGELVPTHPVDRNGEFVLTERVDDYCSTAFWYQTLPTQRFPVFPDREARSAGLELRDVEKG